MKLDRILKESGIIQESKISQVVAQWKAGRLVSGKVRQQIGLVQDDATGQPLTGTQVKLRMVQAGMKENDPLMPEIKQAADTAFTSSTGREDYKQEREKEQRRIGTTIKGAAKRQSKPFFQET